MKKEWYPYPVNNLSSLPIFRKIEMGGLVSRGKVNIRDVYIRVAQIVNVTRAVSSDGTYRILRH